MKNQIKKDIQRSLSLLLACILLLCSYPAIPAYAEENLDIADAGKQIGVFLGNEWSLDADGSYVQKDALGISGRYVVLKSSGSITIDVHSNVPLTGDVYYVTDDNSEIPIFSYYCEGASLVSDSTQLVCLMLPQFTNDVGITQPSSSNFADVYLPYNSSSECANNHGLKSDFITYLRDKNLSTEVAAITSFLTDSANAGRLRVKYKLEKDSVEANCTIDGYTVLSCENVVENYIYGYRLGYSRIENMTDYHNEGNYSSLKMYKGDLYVDAASLPGSITIPNYNKTNCNTMNSLYLSTANGITTLWDDGAVQTTVKSGYNYEMLFPSPVPTLNEAMKEYLQIFMYEYIPYDHIDEYFQQHNPGIPYSYDNYGRINKLQTALDNKLNLIYYDNRNRIEVSVGDGIEQKNFCLLTDWDDDTYLCTLSELHTDGSYSTVFTATTSDDAMAELQERPDVLNALENYLLEENDIYYSFTNEPTIGTSGSPVSIATVTTDSITIPVDQFDTTEGADNRLWNYWYAGSSNYYFIPSFTSDAYDRNYSMLHYGKETTYGYSQPGTDDVIRYDLIGVLYRNELTNIIFAKVPDAIQKQQETYETEDSSLTISWSKPQSDHGAEVLGYQIAIINKNANPPTDDQYQALNAAAYTDLGDTYSIGYATATDQTTYQVTGLDTADKDVYIRAVNVIGPGPATKITVDGPATDPEPDPTPTPDPDPNPDPYPAPNPDSPPDLTPEPDPAPVPTPIPASNPNPATTAYSESTSVSVPVQTGDESNLAAWTILLLLSCVALARTIAYKRKYLI